MPSNKKRKLGEDQSEDKSGSYINLEDDEYNDLSKSYSAKVNKVSNSKMRIKLGSNSNLKIGKIEVLMFLQFFF